MSTSEDTTLISSRVMKVKLVWLAQWRTLKLLANVRETASDRMSNSLYLTNMRLAVKKGLVLSPGPFSKPSSSMLAGVGKHPL